MHHTSRVDDDRNASLQSNHNKVRPLKRATLFIIMYALTVVLLWSFTLSASTAFATNKPFSSPFPSRSKATSSKRTILNTLPLFLSDYPVIAESVTAGTMACLGDLMAQRTERRPYDAKRTSHFMFKGIGEGIMWSVWYRMVEQWSQNIVMAILASFRELKQFEIALKVSICIALDLLVACPLIYGLWDTPIPSLLRGERNILQQVRAKLPEMVFASVKLWLPVNIVVYNLPVEYRVFLSSTADVFWQSIVSSISSRPLLGDGPELDRSQVITWQ